MTDQTTKSISNIVQRFDARPEMLVQILQAIVQAHGWVSEDTIRQLAQALNLSRADVHGVVEYYHDFRTAQPGRNIVKICQAEACQAMGSRELTQHAHAAVDAGTTIEPVYCLGNCACAPAVMVNGKTIGRVDAARFDALVADLRGAEK
ncbi:MAG: NAD(P)H-dependent oxidoreductase subunit E [Gammaproteobacteria bacterium]|nr:NAD(P)H-dependent oxidoreductase subunit E [Gammaproteobacteria bacterium]